MRFTGPWVALVVFVWGGPLVAADKPLNLLVVTADDMSADSGGWNGNTLGAPPNLDAFAKREAFQKRVEMLHKSWTKDREYLPPPTVGKLADLDSGVLVTPPKGLETGYVPIVTRQDAKEQKVRCRRSTSRYSPTAVTPRPRRRPTTGTWATSWPTTGSSGALSHAAG